MSAPTVGNSALEYVDSGGHLATTIAVGNGILAFAFAPTANGVTGISDGANTYTAASSNPITDSNNGKVMYAWWVPSSGVANPTLTIAAANTNALVIGYAEIVGANASSFVDAQAGKGDTSGGSGFMSNPVTTTVANDLAVSFVVDSNSGIAYTAGAGYTRIQSLVDTTDGRYGAIAWAQPAVGSTNPSWTNSGVNGGCCFTIALKAVPSGAGTAITPSTGAAALAGNAPSMNLGISPLTARKAWDYTKGLLVPSRKIFLPPRPALSWEG